MPQKNPGNYWTLALAGIVAVIGGIALYAIASLTQRLSTPYLAPTVVIQEPASGETQAKSGQQQYKIIYVTLPPLQAEGPTLEEQLEKTYTPTATAPAGTAPAATSPPTPGMTSAASEKNRASSNGFTISYDADTFTISSNAVQINSLELTLYGGESSENVAVNGIYDWEYNGNWTGFDRLEAMLNGTVILEINR